MEAERHATNMTAGVWQLIQKFFILLTDSTTLRFTAAGATLPARRIRILPINKHD
jgi:hypothetical protein